MRKFNGNFSFTFFLVVVGIVLSSFSLPIFGNISSQERSALIALYDSTDGDNWTNNSGWKTPPLDVDGFAMSGTENTWYGITCDPGNTTVQWIYLNYNNLNGTLPPELGNLANLQNLTLSGNQLSGTIPPELGNLANLQYLHLSGNQLSGTIPLELANLANLRNLNLGGNQLSGTIPMVMGNLANLHYLILRMNKISGTIPPELGNLANLQHLDLSGNQLSGTIPTVLENLANLQHLDLSVNQLIGSIPPEPGNLVNLQHLDLSGNQLSGTIPMELTNLANLQHLDLGWNQLSGTIPPELGNLANLLHLNLGSNQLSGTIPPDLGNLVNLQFLCLYFNQLSGTIPPELGNLANLELLYLRRNQLSDSIPPELGNLLNLQDLNLSENQFSGSIPPELGNLANLKSLSLEYNQLSGSIPPELGNLANLKYLCFYANQFSSNIPPELGNLVNLKDLSLGFNQLNGSIPPELANLANLQYIDISRNQFSGSIPPELGNLANLQYLRLNENQLSGSLPAELGNLVKLEEFWLHSNQLSGSIPSNLTNLTNLRNGNLNLKCNALYTNDDILRDFLDSKQNGGNWESTQTIAPSDVSAVAVSTTSIAINWTPITYTSATGGYSVFYSTTPGGPYTYFGITANKSASSLTVTGLDPDTNYYFVVQTRTDPHTFNQNTVDSEYSAEVSAETPSSVTLIISGTITSGGNGLQGVTVTLSNGGGTAVTDGNGNYSVTVPYGWTGTATPSKPGYNFSPANRNYTNVTVNQTGQDYTVAFLSTERAALIALYNSTDGDNWTNNSGWKTPPLHVDGFALPGTENTWYGITCDPGNTTVQSISLVGNNLNGTLPPELGNLANLQRLYLSSNQLSGTIPLELGNLAKLEYLGLHLNQLTGSIPPELGNLANLLELSLHKNQFSGSIPPELGNLANLLWLDLGNNQLSGSIPPELGKLANLLSLSLSGNQLSGSIPPELGNLANLEKLLLSLNQLSGAIPPELGNLANLQTLSLYRNQLSGSIPPELENLANLQSLDLGYNQLSGSIPPGLGNLANLLSLSLSGNQLSSTIPPGLGNLANLKDLHLYGNRLSGSIPSDLTNLTNLFSLDLRWNALYTNDDILRAFLDSKQSGGNWESTQTIAPSDVTAEAVSTTSIDINWTPITYTSATGGYRVFHSTTAGGPYTYFGITTDKSASSLIVTGLNPGTTYYFVVQTRTNPHTDNQNTVDSEYSAEVSAGTSSPGTLTISGTITSGGNGLQGVTVTLSNGGGTAVTDDNGDYSVTVIYGWTGTATPSKPGYNFSPANRSYTNVTVDQTGQDYTAAFLSTERAALIALYNSTDGDNWANNTGWKTPPLDVDGFAMPGTEKDWYGISYGPGNTTVQMISLFGNNLNGTLPPELGNLANLKWLWLSYNQISGAIPPELGNLANLQDLDLKHNQLSGTIPPELENLANLKYLYLDKNQLSGSIPPILGNLAKLEVLSLSSNRLSGSIPPELGNLANLKYLYLDKNQLSGSIPPILGNLAKLEVLSLSSNQLSGGIPANLTNLTNLLDGFLDLRWNGLYTNDDILRAFLDSKQSGGNWESTQTIAPSDVSAVAVSTTSIDINWTPITYTSAAGGYRVFYSTTAGGPYTYSGITADKSASSLTISGLNPDTNYYFVVQTRTNPHMNNQNTVDSEYSAEVSAETSSVTLTISGTITSGENGLQGVTITLSNSSVTAVTDANGNYSVTVIYGWTGTATPSKPGYNFSPANRSYTNVTVDQTNQDYTAALQTVTIAGKVTSGGSGLTGVTIILSNSGGTTATNANGNYTGIVSYGWTGTATPSKPGYTFTPGNRSYSNVTVNQTNQDFLGNPVSTLTLTSPNGGESWGLSTIRDITWTSSGLSGNIRLELWKANRKICDIANNIPIVNGRYAWTVGISSPDALPVGNDYRVKIITAGGLYSDTSDGKFSIVKPSITLTSPRSGQRWKRGTRKNITWTSVGLTGKVRLRLWKFLWVRTIVQGIPIANGTYSWKVGRYSNGMASAGRYTVMICTEDGRFWDFSGSFRITD